MKTRRSADARQRALLLALAALVVILGAALALALRQKAARGPAACSMRPMWCWANCPVKTRPNAGPSCRRW